MSRSALQKSTLPIGLVVPAITSLRSDRNWNAAAIQGTRGCDPLTDVAAIDPLQSMGMDEKPEIPSIGIEPLRGPIRATVRPPGSKSITNRALIVAALASGSSRLTGALDSNDTRVMVESLRQLGLQLTHDLPAQTIDIAGCAGRLPANSAELWLENSGTSIRFLT